MKRIAGSLLLAAALMTNSGSYAQDPKFYIFLCFGRSNMEGNHLHFTAAGYRELGRRYGVEMLSLLEPVQAAPNTKRPEELVPDAEKARQALKLIYITCGDHDAGDMAKVVAPIGKPYF